MPLAHLLRTNWTTIANATKSSYGGWTSHLEIVPYSIDQHLCCTLVFQSTLLTKNTIVSPFSHLHPSKWIIQVFGFFMILITFYFGSLPLLGVFTSSKVAINFWFASPCYKIIYYSNLTTLAMAPKPSKISSKIGSFLSFNFAQAIFLTTSIMCFTFP